MTKQQATGLTNSFFTTTCCLLTWALHSSRFMHAEYTNKQVYGEPLCLFAIPLFSLSVPVFFNLGRPCSFLPFVFLMDVRALWFSPVLISPGVLLFMSFPAEWSVSRFRPPTVHFSLTFSLPFVRLVFQAQDFYVEMKWEFTSWGRLYVL